MMGNGSNQDWEYIYPWDNHLQFAELKLCLTILCSYQFKLDQVNEVFEDYDNETLTEWEF